ncbi:hypothetical protein CF327_g6787 [Tilletia walkeri]|nr:hypothetical protein CF327_g6787 [Tilletia walkeri]
MKATPTPFDMTLEQVTSTVCNALASLRATVEKVRFEVGGVTAELEAKVEALGVRQEQQHAEVMGAIGGMLVMGQGTRQNQNHTRLVQSALAEGLKSIMSVWHQLSSTITSHDEPSSFHTPQDPQNIMPLMLTAAAPSVLGPAASPSPVLSSSSDRTHLPPTSTPVASAPSVSVPSQLETILRALNNSAPSSPSYQLSVLKSAVAL